MDTDDGAGARRRAHLAGLRAAFDALKKKPPVRFEATPQPPGPIRFRV